MPDEIPGDPPSRAQMEQFQREATDLVQQVLLFVGSHESAAPVKAFATIFCSAVLWRRIMLEDRDGHGWRAAMRGAWQDSKNISIEPEKN